MPKLFSDGTTELATVGIHATSIATLKLLTDVFPATAILSVGLGIVYRHIKGAAF